MSKQNRSRKAFTLIEVMVAVMIISVVIAGLIQMYANNTHIFTSFKNQTVINQYSSFLVANKNYGSEDKRTDIYALVDTFKVKDELRRELKDQKVEIIYKELARMHLDESNDDEYDKDEIADLRLEVGESVIKTKDSSFSFIRFKLQ